MINLVGMIGKYSHQSYFLEYMLVSIYTIKKTMGWCPNINSIESKIFQKNAQIFHDYTNSGGINFSPVQLKNVFIKGLTKEAIIGITFILVFWIAFRRTPFFEDLIIEFAILTTFLILIAETLSTIEINNDHIRINTILHRFIGSTTHTIDSIDSIQVYKCKTYRLLYIFIVSVDILMAILYLFFFFSDLIAGEALQKLIHDLIWPVLLFGLGFQYYNQTKSRSNIQIRFKPYPSINTIRIYTKDAGEIADMLAQVNKHEHKLDIDEKKDRECSE